MYESADVFAQCTSSTTWVVAGLRSGLGGRSTASRTGPWRASREKGPNPCSLSSLWGWWRASRLQKWLLYQRCLVFCLLFWYELCATKFKRPQAAPTGHLLPPLSPDLFLLRLRVAISVGYCHSEVVELAVLLATTYSISSSHQKQRSLIRL